MTPAAADRPVPDDRLDREWLLANRIGGYALGTAAAVNTRRYHGLLVAALRPPVGRVVALHSVIEELLLGDRVISLSAHQFGDELVVHPDGLSRLDQFTSLDPGTVSWTWRVAGMVIHRTVSLPPWSNVVEIEYEVQDAPAGARLRLRPLTPLRDAHELTRQDEPPPEVLHEGDDGVTLRRDEALLALRALGRAAPRWHAEPQWWRDFAYREDRDRGQSWREDVWSPGAFELALDANPSEVVLLRGLARPATTPWPQLAIDPRTAGQRHARGPEPVARLRQAAQHYLVARLDGTTWGQSIIAGYPWFTDWGRDTMISLPGLLLDGDRPVAARAVLDTYAGHLQRGLIPCRFDDQGQGADYASVDASLWFVHAVCAYLDAVENDDPGPLLDACRQVLRAYRRGTDFGIRLDEDGLLTAGDDRSALTWMDARRGDEVFTPRHGKAIEVNALWHHALHALAKHTPDTREATELRKRAGATARAIQASFWWTEQDCLHDVLMPDGEGWRPDAKLRPNQIFAVSLDPSPLTLRQQQAVLDVVRRRLLTPCGLRTLDPDDPGYRGRYEGDMRQRDEAYHNGTVWPWLIGPYSEAVLRAGAFSDAARAEVLALLAPLHAELDRACLGQIAEVYDGDAPHRPDGCPAQAWSVAEVLRVSRLAQPAPGTVVRVPHAPDPVDGR